MPDAITKEENPLGTKPLGGLLFSLAVPAIIATVVNSLYNMRMAARMPLPLDETIWNVPPNELTRDAMFDNPMPQSIIACGLNPRPSSV